MMTAVLGAAVIIVIVIAMIALAPAKTTYLPGRNTEGLTQELNRDIPADYPQVTFIDATKKAGINFTHFQGTRTFQLPEDMGSGAAWGDYDNDGWLDLFVVNFAGPLAQDEKISPEQPAACVLYHNNQDGTFTDMSIQAGLDKTYWGMAAAWGDFDNDRWPDLFISTYGQNHVFHNNGDGTFTERSDQAGISAYEGFWTGVALGDFNLDGYLDVYICGYVRYAYQTVIESSMQYDVEVPASINPSAFPPEPNLLFRNNRDGTFTEVAKQAGVTGENGRSLCAVWADFNADGWPDIYVANDVSDNVFYQNLGDGRFAEISHSALVADYRGAMGIAVGDWDRDADYDMFVTHWVAQENALYDNLYTQLTSGPDPLRELRFMDAADRYGLGQIALDFIGWGTSFIDYDNDGKLDLFVVNGSTFQQKENPNLLIPMRDQLFWNKGNQEGFFEVSSVSGAVFKEPFVGRGAAFGDYDNDGDVDVFIVNNGGPAQLLQNAGGSKHNWIEVLLEGVASNTSGIGGKVRVTTSQSSQIQQVGAQGSYCSQNSLIQHFGLNDVQQIDSLEVLWPSGKRQLFTDISVNQRVRIVEDQPGIIPLSGLQ